MIRLDGEWVPQILVKIQNAKNKDVGCLLTSSSPLEREIGKLLADK